MSALRWISIALLATVLLVLAAYVLSMWRAYDRISGKSAVFPSPYGDIEFTTGGSGPPVLVVHGSGGGYDQGEWLALSLLGDEFQWIAPSRFGYLRSSLPTAATFDEQAHAYKHLVNHLGIDRVAVVALSHGCPSALLFAALHPERVATLTLLSCGVASLPTKDQDLASQKGDALKWIFQYDPLYWVVSTLLRKQLMELMGATEGVIADLTPAQRTMVDRVIDIMNPVAPRVAGVALDNRAALPNERIAAIRAPTQIFHATDDKLQLLHNAQFAASAIPGARLHTFNRGGHLLIAVEQEAIRSEVQAFIRAHANHQPGP